MLNIEGVINLHTIYFIGKDIYNFFPQLFMPEVRKDFYTFSSVDNFISSNEYNELFSAINLQDTILELVLICDKNNLTYLKKNPFLCKLKTIYIYEDLHYKFKSAFENIKYIYEDNYYRNHDFYFIENRLKMLQKDDSTQILITGLSYALMGLDEKLMKYKCSNLSLPSQDIYYSYKLCQEVLSYNKNIKYCIVGLSYYSLNFDLSLCGEANLRVNSVYAPILNDYHNYKGTQESYTQTQSLLNNYLDENLKQLFNAEKIEVYFKNIYYEELSRTYFTPRYSREYLLSTYYSINQLSEPQREEFSAIKANRHNNLLTHSHTVSENITILGELLKFLNNKNIKPILCVFPSTSYYNKYFSSDFFPLFYNCINNYKNIFDFLVVDLNTFEDFTIMDFIDPDHLNASGAVKATNLLNTFIK